MINYYDNWRNELYECKNCGWKGLGEKLIQGEVFRELFEVDCPSCRERVSTVMHPTLAESRENWDKVSSEDKAMIEFAESRQADFAQRALRTPAQLPDLTGNDLVIVWDIENYDGGDTIIRCGDEVLWCEPAFYEGYERFVEVADILFQRYGKRIKDFIPSSQSEMCLYGDRIGAPGVIESCRRKLTRNRLAKI
jgi:hypothetical protein